MIRQYPLEGGLAGKAACSPNTMLPVAVTGDGNHAPLGC